MNTYQPAPEGLWRSSPRRILLWSTLQVLDRLTKQSYHEAERIADWQSKLQKALYTPVKDFDWNGLVAKDDSGDPKVHVPAEVVASWGAIEDLIPALWLDGAVLRTSALGLPFAESDLDAAIGKVGSLVKSIPENAAARLQSLLRDTIAAADESQFDFARKIRSEWAGVSKFRSEQIAVTEWNRAASGATLIGYEQQGIGTKVWITVGDDRVCIVCQGNAAQGEIPIGASFGDADAPPQHPACRCSIAAGFA